MKVVVLGASPHPWRYSWLAVERLLEAGHEVVPIGNKEAQVAGLPILTDIPQIEHVDTVTIYLNPDNQQAYADWLVETLRPRRLIFNPGAENPPLQASARQAGIEVVNACTLVMLSTGQF
ncbi:MAG: CoA-binding protein [Saprospiraceae bacterium]|nr:MAG: CoA-binding protein [Saprospiraceae bacterium]